MADFEFLAKLRAAGVKSATFNIHEQVQSVEFFPVAVAPPTPSPLDFDTLIPPAPPVEGEEGPAARVKTPPALARLLKNGSVS